MSRIYGKYQTNYFTAKAALYALESSQTDAEREYITKNNIQNPDGEIPACLYCIEDDDVFNRANEELSKLQEDSDFQEQINTARNALKNAEDKLISWGLSLAPGKVRDTLTKEAKANYTTRLKIIDLSLKLDITTLPKHLRTH